MAKKTENVDISNMSKDAAMTLLIGDKGYSFKEAEAYWKENGSAVRGVIFQSVLDYLAETDRTQSDLAAWIIKNGSANEARWFSQRDAIRRLSVTVRATKSFKDVAITEAQKNALKAKVDAVKAK